ncbi:Hos4 protein [Maudiozyma humilis]|uniref:Hos4 protein n=1 Tax=Maudiozyma humilis TaxID=51915 RepID=A0AAV5RYR1_MAUHU|nr:Hos4 protein [Kazachstania humilis]
MTKSDDKQPIKKRSLSSYLSNVSSRKEELIKIAQAEKERVAREKQEKERQEKERLEQERLERERLEKERLEKIEQERLEKERLEKIEQERLEKERQEKERLDKIEQERIAKEKQEQERIEREKLEQERIEREKLEQERIAQEKIEQDRLAKEKLEEERLAKVKLEQEQIEKEKLHQEQLEKEKLEQERHAKETLEQERTAKEKAATPSDVKEESATPTSPLIRSESISHEIHRVEKRNTDHLIPDEDDEEEYEYADEEDRRANPVAATDELQHTRSHDPFSRDTLKSMLQEPQPRSLLDDDSEGAAQSLRSHSNRSHMSDLQESKPQYKGLHAEDTKLQYKEIGSDEETEEGSPLKVRGVRLRRGDRQTTQNLQADLLVANDSDSDLSAIEDDARQLDISSSFLHGNSSPQRHQSAHAPLPSSPVRGKPARSPRREPPSKSARKNGTKGKAKSRRSVYRDAGGRTRLQIACDKGKLDTVRALLAAGEIDVNDQDNAGNTPLHEAALNGHLEVVRVLVEHGADPNVRSYEMFGDTPLIDASANGHLDVVSYLLAHGADPTITNAKGMTAYEAIESDDSDLDDSERELVGEIRSVLRAAAKDTGETSQELGDSHKNKNSSPAHSRSRSRSSSPARRDTPPAIPFYWNDITTAAGAAKLHRAAKAGDLAYVGQYLENGGRADFRAFFEAARLGHAELANLFLAFGASVNSAARGGVTPLMAAVGRGHLPTVRLLLGAGASVHAVDDEGRNALQYARDAVLGREDPEEVALLRDAMGSGPETSSHSAKRQRAESVSSDSSAEELPRVHSHKRSRQGTPLVVENDESESEGDNEAVETTQDNDTVETVEKHDTVEKQLPEENNTPQVKRGESEEAAALADGEKRSAANATAPAAPTETPEERALRLKAEEEYRQRKIHNKKRKEQELLHKMQEDQRKREEERQRQRDAAAQLAAQQRLQEETQRRKAIRAQYPLGLRILTAGMGGEPSTHGLPLFYTQLPESAERYVLNLQLLMWAGDSAAPVESASADVPAVSLRAQEQLWNLAKFAFLFGCDTALQQQFAQCDAPARLAFERAEYAKFARLPMRWLPWSAVSAGYAPDIPMQRIAAVDSVQGASASATTHTTAHAHTTAPAPAHALTLPFKLQHRHAVASWLRNGARPARDTLRAPLW